jgi:NADH-ubiquinone oxidoreductase chain 3
MTSTTFFFIFIPLLAVILLAVNLIFAPHNPYQEKNSAFECGFHSFLGQNRTEFSISFFIFALLFLLFDLEILLVYPYVVSAYTNGIYGLVIMLIFFLALTLGFAFELGKNALKIDSRQMISFFRKKDKSLFSLISTFSFIRYFRYMKNIKNFSTSSYLGSDNGRPADEVNTNVNSNDQATVETNTNTDSQAVSANVSDDGSGSQAFSADVSNDGSGYETNPDQAELDDDEANEDNTNADSDDQESFSDDGSGYETNPDRAELDDDGAAMMNYTARDLPDDKLKEFLKETRDIYRNHLREGEEELRQTFQDRHGELKSEKERRITEGTMSDHSSSVGSDPSTPAAAASPAASPAASLELESSPKADNNDQEKDKSSDNELPSSSNNKRKFEEDSESSVQRPKDFQDSRDITSEGEPFDFCGGDD